MCSTKTHFTPMHTALNCNGMHWTIFFWQAQGCRDWITSFNSWSRSALRWWSKRARCWDAVRQIATSSIECFAVGGSTSPPMTTWPLLYAESSSNTQHPQHSRQHQLHLQGWIGSIYSSLYVFQSSMVMSTSSRLQTPTKARQSKNVWQTSHILIVIMIMMIIPMKRW